MSHMPQPEEPSAALPLYCVTDREFPAWRDAQPAGVRGWLDANGFLAERGRWMLLPGADGGNAGVVIGLGKQAPTDTAGWFWLGAALSDRLPFASSSSWRTGQCW